MVNRTEMLAARPVQAAIEHVSAGLKAVFQSAFDPCVQRVQPVQGQCLGRFEAAPGQGVGSVVGQDAVGQRVQLRVQGCRALPFCRAAAGKDMP